MNVGKNEQFQTQQMNWQGARAAYPLVRLHDATITLEKWLRFAKQHCRIDPSRTGLIAIRDCRDIVHALFSYKVEFDPHFRKRLCVANLIIAHLPGSQIDEAVARSTRHVSAQLGCQTITLERPFFSVVQAMCPTAEALRKQIYLPIGVRTH